MPVATQTPRHAAEARAWRLALLLTGSEDLAAEVAIQVRRAQPKLESLDPRRLDRLVVLRSREVVQRAGRGRSAHAPGPALLEVAREAPREAGELLAALAGIDEQPREAWIFARLDGLDEVEVARSMDCSKTATGRFLTEAEMGIAARLSVAEAAAGARPGAGPGAGAEAEPGPEPGPGPGPGAAATPDLAGRIEAVRRWLAARSPQEAIEARRAVHRRRRRMWLGFWLLVVLAVATGVLLVVASL